MSKAWIAIISISLAFPVMLIWHVVKAFWTGIVTFFILQKEWWTLVGEDFDGRD